jgi:hypothetical protein
MLSYNCTLGIPGYTGFNPGHSLAVVPTKGSTIRTGMTLTLTREPAVCT